MRKKIVCFYFIIFFFCMSISGCVKDSTQGRILYVDQENYHSIQDAINAANDNDIIKVSAGTYYETLVIDKSIQLIAAAPHNTIITVNDNYQDHPDILQIKSQGCTIQGFTIIGDYPRTNASGISIFSTNNSVSQNNISVTFYGIHLESDAKKNTISDNIITGSQHALYVSSDNNKIFNNKLTHNFYGIYLFHSLNNGIFLNYIMENAVGIRFKAAINNQIYENQINENTDGIYSCCGAMQNMIFKNNFINNSRPAYDELPSSWDVGGIGNYWSDYLLEYPDAQSQNNIWEIPYNISGGKNQDRYPVVIPFSIEFF